MQAIDPNMTGLLIREAKAHNEVITSLEKMVLSDFKGIVTCSKDNRVRTWSNGLDLLGSLNQRTDMDDPKWIFPTRHKQIVRQ